MAMALIILSVEEQCIIKFLVKEKVKPAEILHALNAHCGEQTLSYQSAYDWYNMSSESCREGLILSHTHIQPTAVHNMNIRHIRIIESSYI
jgi:hypothetical protein